MNTQAVAVPCGYLLAFNAKLGISGLWWGYAMGLCILMVILLQVESRIDWHLEVNQLLVHHCCLF